jgi:ABC-type glutathione transport system ATPase component
MKQTMTALLEVQDMSVTLKLAEGEMTAVQDVSFTVDRGETLGIVGESGSGKSVSSMAIMGLLPRGTRTEATHAALWAMSDLAKRVRRTRWRDCGATKSR